MNWRWLITISSVVGMLFVIAAGCGIINCDPSLPLSDKNGTAKIFAANENEVTLAITNAFGSSKFRKMILEPAGERKVEWNQGWQLTNGFILFSFHDPVAYVPVLSVFGKRQLPYISYFHIAVTPQNSNKTHIVVRTVFSEVIYGKEIGVHGGWANHYRKVAPVRREEDHVIEAISEQLSLSQPHI